jgi:hypothetical protein
VTLAVTSATADWLETRFLAGIGVDLRSHPWHQLAMSLPDDLW